MYRASNTAMTMKKAREVLLSLAPDEFKISLSSCYNYTESNHSGSAQASRHHQGKDVNAPISLRKPPRTGVQQLVINLHWSTANVNLMLDSCQDLSQCLIGCKKYCSCRYSPSTASWTFLEEPLLGPEQDQFCYSHDIFIYGNQNTSS